MQILSILLIAIALSMDTFSLSLSIGSFNISLKKSLILSIIVGIMHFLMPLIGLALGSKIISVLTLKCELLLGIILIVIAIQMLLDLINKKEEQYNLNLLGMLLIAFGVSLDSFSVGLGINALTSNVYLATTIFSICSFIFTLLGLLLGKYASLLIGKYANILGIIILFILGLFHIF